MLRGSYALRDTVCVNPSTGGAFSWWGDVGQMIINGSIGFRGQLIVVAVPRGSIWALTLSDVPVARTADTDIGPSDRRRALEANMRPRQLGEAARR